MGVENQERRGARRPTMREVAAVAGVSLSTVSRVVNGGDGVDTAPGQPGLGQRGSRELFHFVG